MAKGDKARRRNLVKALKAAGVKDVTPALIRAAGDFTGAQSVISSLRAPSEAEVYYGNAVRRLKTDAEIEAEKTGAFERTRGIAQDLAISAPQVVSGFTGALGGLAADLAAFGGGDARALMGIEGAGQSVSGMIEGAGRAASGVSASVADLIAANADLYAAESRRSRDEKREELLKSKRLAADERKKALIAAESSAQSGLLSNLVTLMGLRPAAGGYGGGSGRSGGGGDRTLTNALDISEGSMGYGNIISGRNMEGLIGTSSSTSGGGGGGGTGGTGGTGGSGASASVTGPGGGGPTIYGSYEQGRGGWAYQAPDRRRQGRPGGPGAGAASYR